MLPLRDDNPTRGTPVVTIALIALNVVAFLYEWAIGFNVATFRYGLIPMCLTHGVGIEYSGARLGLMPGQVVLNLQPAWLTIFTSMFMHANWLHILGNMWFLWIFGDNVEEEMGPAKYLGFYLVCGIAAALTQVLFGPTSKLPMVGASGAIAGVLGAYLVIFPGSRVLYLIIAIFITTIELPAWLGIGIWFVIQAVSSLGSLGAGSDQGGVANFAHVGGFAAGWLIVRVVGVGRKPPPRYYTPQPDFNDWRG